MLENVLHWWENNYKDIKEIFIQDIKNKIKIQIEEDKF